MGSMRGINPFGGASGTTEIVTIREMQRKRNEYRNKRKIGGCCKSLTSVSSAVDHIIMKIMPETFLIGILSRIQSFTSKPFLFSIQLKKKGK